jgi:hypothetical protein
LRIVLKWRARKDSNLRPSESKSAQQVNDFNAYSELSRSVHPLTTLKNCARSECHSGDFDGRNRYMAARQLGIEYPLTEYEGSDPLGYVISLNLKRRHLSESQRAMVAAKLANMPDGGDRSKQHSANLHSASEAAAMLNVSERTVKTAKQVQEHGAPELQHAVESGQVSVSAAADIATKPKEEQREIVARGEREILEAAKAIRAEKAILAVAQIQTAARSSLLTPELACGQYPDKRILGPDALDDPLSRFLSVGIPLRDTKPWHNLCRMLGTGVLHHSPRGRKAAARATFKRAAFL